MHTLPISHENSYNTDKDLLYIILIQPFVLVTQSFVIAIVYLTEESVDISL